MNRMKQKNLDRHNQNRCMHGVEKLTWNDKIARNAQKWAKEVGGQLKHSTSADRTDVAGYGYLGENLAWSSVGSGRGSVRSGRAVNACVSMDLVATWAGSS